MSELPSASLINSQAGIAIEQGRSLPNVRGAKNLAQARKTAQEFEAVFLGQMLQPMFQNIEAAEPFGGGSSEKMWKTMQVEEYGKAIAKSGGIGLADAVFREIIKTQELQ
ncbi:MAG: chemotaxis protein [Alphaproteobacteria bacterium]|jgi:peptidoglycan hydrolase FlgJ|nr:chemotaxis protein [Alphaproteobacteria bacterium]MBT7942465.1 chemotaxis protein [Alphaproteobacteria bacterium]